MAIYRITRFTSQDMNKASAMADAARDEIATVGADFIDVAADDDGNGVVVARYPDSATMEAATPVARKVFGQMIADGVMDGESVDIWTGDVVNSM